jgi:hypothetical protein
MAAEKMRVVFMTSNDAPGWIPGKVYQGRIEGSRVVFDRDEVPGSVDFVDYSGETKDSIENGFNVKQIEGEKAPPYSQDDLEEIYLKQHKDNLGYMKTLNALHRFGKSGGRKSKRRRPKRKSKRKSRR